MNAVEWVGLMPAFVNNVWPLVVISIGARLVVTCAHSFNLMGRSKQGNGSGKVLDQSEPCTNRLAFAVMLKKRRTRAASHPLQSLWPGQ